MTLWVWILVGVAAYLILSVAFMLALARMLGRIRRTGEAEVEAEEWTLAPLERERRAERERARARTRGSGSGPSRERV